MKRKALKITGLFCALAMTAGLLGGCAGQGDSKTEVVRVWTSDAGSKDIMTKMVSDYNATIGKEEGIQIDYQVFGGDFNQTLNMALESDQAPEMFSAPSDVRSMVKKGQLVALEDLPDTEAFLKGYDGELLEDINVVDGKTYHVPFKVTTTGLIYNKDLFKKAGIVDEQGEALPPKTWEEVREYAKRITSEAESTYGFAFPLKWDSVFYFDFTVPFSTSVPFDGYDFQNGRFDFTVYKPAFEWLTAMKADGSCFPGAEGLDNDMARAQFAAGRVGMMIGASWDVSVFSEQFPAQCDWSVAPAPYFEDSERYASKSTIGPFLAITSEAKKKDLNKISKVYQWFNSKEVLTKLYEEGYYIPYDISIIENATVKTEAKGWAEFAGLLEKQDVVPEPPSIKLEGDNDYTIYSKVWAGSVGIEEALKDLTDRSNAAVEKGVNDGSIDKSKLVDSSVKKNPLPKQ